MKISTRTMAAAIAATGVMVGIVATPASSQAQTITLPTSSIPVSSSLPGPLLQLLGGGSNKGGATTPANLESLRPEIINESNRFRAQNNKHALRANAALNAEAQRRAEELARNLEAKHYDLSPLAPHHGAIAENLHVTTADQVSPQTAVASWAGSDGHKQNLLREDVNHIGIGIAKGSDNFWRVVAIYSER